MCRDSLTSIQKEARWRMQTATERFPYTISIRGERHGGSKFEPLSAPAVLTPEVRDWRASTHRPYPWKSGTWKAKRPQLGRSCPISVGRWLGARMADFW